MLPVYDATVRYVNQGDNKEPGTFAEPWHDGIFDFIYLEKNHGKEEACSRNPFITLWIPDLL